MVDYLPCVGWSDSNDPGLMRALVIQTILSQGLTPVWATDDEIRRHSPTVTIITDDD